MRSGPSSVFKPSLQHLWSAPTPRHATPPPGLSQNFRDHKQGVFQRARFSDKGRGAHPNIGFSEDPKL